MNNLSEESTSEFCGGNHLRPDSVIAEIAQAACVGVSKVGSLKGNVGILHLGAVAEAAFVHLNSDASVGIPERHSLKGPSVDLLDGEEVIVDSRFQDVRADLNVLKHIPGHLQTIVHQFEGWEKYVLEQLKITVVAVR